MHQWMLLWALVGLGISAIIIFNFVAFYGAPFLPTKRQRVEEALDLLNLRAGQTLLELGSGDGRLLLAAAKRGVKSIGYELNPVLVAWSKLRCWRYRELVTIELANYWQRSLPAADAIYVFLLQPYMARLDTKVQAEALRPLRLVSFAFPITNKRPTIEQNGMFAYDFPRAQK